MSKIINLGSNNKPFILLNKEKINKVTQENKF